MRKYKIFADFQQELSYSYKHKYKPKYYILKCLQFILSFGPVVITAVSLKSNVVRVLAADNVSLVICKIVK